MNVDYRLANRADLPALVRLRNALWPDEPEEHPAQLQDHFDGEPCHIDAVIVAQDEQGQLQGFAELRVRNYAEGSEALAVPFLEGWYVTPPYRGRGIGTGLVEAAADWSRELGFTELASNALLDNPGSIKAHLALGFEEIERTVSFLKALPGNPEGG